MTHNAAHAMHERSLELQVATCPRSEFQIFFNTGPRKAKLQNSSQKADSLPAAPCPSSTPEGESSEQLCSGETDCSNASPPPVDPMLD